MDPSFVIERILWRSRRNSFFQRGGVEFKDAPGPVQSEINELLEKNETPVIVATDGTSWTCITDQRVISSHESSIVSVSHEEINRTVRLTKDESAADKIERIDKAEWILVGDAKIPVWTPQGMITTGMMNTLLMLPLGSGNTNPT